MQYFPIFVTTVALAVASSALALPAASPSPAITPAASLDDVQRRQDKSPRIGGSSDTITATFDDGQVTTYTLANGVSIGNDASNNEVIQIETDIAAAINSIFTPTDMFGPSTVPLPTEEYNGPPTLSKRDNIPASATGSGASATLEKRVDPPMLQNLVVNEQVQRFIEEMIEQAGVPGNALQRAIPMDAGPANFPQLPAALSDFVTALIAHANAQRGLRAFNVNRRVAFVKMCVLWASALFRGISVSEREVAAAHLFREAPNPRPNLCQKDMLNWPICEDENCVGDDRKCTLDPNKGCDCLPELSGDLPQTFSDDEDQKQLQFLDEALHNIPTCNPQTSAQFVGNDAAISAINDFCGTSTIHQATQKTLNGGSPDEVLLKIDMQGDAAIAPDDCKAIMGIILDNCNIDPDMNPTNVKRGGSINLPGGGATFTIQPKKGGPLQCNGGGWAKWIDNGAAVAAADDFCRGHDLSGNTNQKIVDQNVKEQGSYDVTLSMLFAGPNHVLLNFDQCVDGFKAVLGGCDSQNPQNPYTQKFGGSFVDGQGVIYTLTPNTVPPTFPPDQRDQNNAVIAPTCDAGRGIWAGATDFNGLIDTACKDGNSLGPNSAQRKDSGIPTTFMHIDTSLTDAQKTYKQGGSVCRNTFGWSGKIIERDCRKAISDMNGMCIAKDGFHASTYEYNCVHYRVYTSFQQ